jgi:hypothetical protein
MADAGVDRQYVDGLLLRNQTLEAVNRDLTTENLRFQRIMEICEDKYGPNFYKYRDKLVSYPIRRSHTYHSVIIHLIFWFRF